MQRTFVILAYLAAAAVVAIIVHYWLFDPVNRPSLSETIIIYLVILAVVWALARLVRWLSRAAGRAGRE